MRIHLVGNVCGFTTQACGNTHFPRKLAVLDLSYVTRVGGCDNLCPFGMATLVHIANKRMDGCLALVDNLLSHNISVHLFHFVVHHHLNLVKSRLSKEEGP